MTEYERMEIVRDKIFSVRYKTKCSNYMAVHTGEKKELKLNLKAYTSYMTDRARDGRYWRLIAEANNNYYDFFSPWKYILSLCRLTLLKLDTKFLTPNSSCFVFDIVEVYARVLRGVFFYSKQRTRRVTENRKRQ